MSNIELVIKKLPDSRLQWSVSTCGDVFHASSVAEIFNRIADAKITNVVDGYFWHNSYIASQNLNAYGFVRTNIYVEQT